TRRRQADFRARITQSIGNAEDFVAALNAFAESFPDSSIAGNVVTFPGELPLWKGLCEWSDFESTTFATGLPRNAKAARDAINRGEELTAAYGDLPLVEQFQ